MAHEDRDDRAGGDVVALVTSAGGLEALSVVLRDLPADLPVAILVQQHLGGQASVLPKILSRRTGRDVAWVVDGRPAAAGSVGVCPPRHQLEVLPDGTCALTELAPSGNRPHDALLTSLADSLGPRAVAVVLTGSGSDGAAGVAAVKTAGGVVIAQSEDTAEYPSMPRAAAAAGADLVLPLHEIGGVVADVVRGGPLPRPNEELEAIRVTFGDDGAVAALARGIDWSGHPLGPVHRWPQSLRQVVRLAVDSVVPTLVFWGEELFTFVNDAALQPFGARVAEAVGARYPQVFPQLEAKEELRTLLTRVLRGTPVSLDAAHHAYERAGRVEDHWFDTVYTPVRDPDGRVVGILCVLFDRSREVLAARRLETLNRLTSSRASSGRREALAAVLSVLDGAADILFAVAYLFDPVRRRANLVGAAGVAAGGAMAQRELRLAPGAGWPLHRVAQERRPVVVADVATRFRGHTAGVEQLVPECAVLHPLHDEAEDRVIGVLVLGTHPRLPLDERYTEFLTVAADTVGARVAESHSRQRERERQDKLAELDRAKMEFFSNVSHEFRTPLTLMLGPLEEMLRDPRSMPPGRDKDLELVGRSAQRLLQLVENLLDFSRAEAGRLPADLVPHDLAELTREIVVPFESAAVRAGLALRATLDPLPEAVWVDPEMWEKVVSNLLSNALKFTFDGTVEVTLRALPQHAELVVRDTGVGIPAKELPFVFKRFHRVRDTRARTHEGAGIGLALADELVRRHQGRIRATSVVGEGTTFTVWIPRSRHPQTSNGTTPNGATPEAPGLSRSRAFTSATAMAEEAARWDVDVDLPTTGPERADPPVPVPRRYAPGARVLVVDDNPDMRDYLGRPLGEYWNVAFARDGQEAVALARRDRPDLIVSDVMMPGLDGFGLLATVRADDALAGTPVVLVTARAGEETAVEGLLAGADDYIVKPFSARELLARVGAQLELSRMRRGTAERQAFLLELSDALRSVADPTAMQRLACRMLRHRLGAERVVYWEAVSDDELVPAAVDAAAAAPPHADRRRLSELGPAVAELRAGRVVRCTDPAAAPALIPEVRALLATEATGGWSTVPLLEQGRLGAVLETGYAGPHDWSPEELSLIRDVADRTGAAVGRARAEAGLRTSEERLAVVFEALPVAVTIMDVDGRVLLSNEEMHRYLPTGVIPSRDDARLGRWRAHHPDERPVDRGDFPAARALRGETVLPGLEMRYTPDDGPDVWTRVAAVPIRAGDGRVTGAFALIVDLDTMKRTLEP